MAPLSPAAAHHRAKIAGLGVGVKTGVRQPDDPELRDAKRDYAAVRIHDYVLRILADAPPLTNEQRSGWPNCCAQCGARSVTKRKRELAPVAESQF